MDMIEVMDKELMKEVECWNCLLFVNIIVLLNIFFYLCFINLSL